MACARRRGADSSPADRLMPNAFLAIDSDGTTTIWCPKLECGQGVTTSMAMLVAEELGADWESVRVVTAEAHPRYGDMRVGGSNSIRRGYLPLRQAGAAAREMLLAAAAEVWRVVPQSLRVEAGRIREISGQRSAPLAAFVSRAARRPVPVSPPLKPANAFSIIGSRRARLDTIPKLTGAAEFGLDVRVPGMRYAALVRPPLLGGSIRSFDPGSALAQSGVIGVQRVGESVAVIAETSWAAMKGAERLAVVLDPAAGSTIDGPTMRRRIRAGALKPGAVAGSTGDAVRALRGQALRFEAVYEVPFHAHATMEPQNCVVALDGDRCRIWAPTQTPMESRAVAARVLGVAEDRVRVQPTYAGGGFGRRSETDFIVEAVRTARAVGGPIQLVWSRADDFRHDFYHPATATRVEALLGPSGDPIAWLQRVSGPSLARRWGALPGGVDAEMTRELSPPWYAIPHHRVEFSEVRLPVPVGYLRSVANLHNIFAIEATIDELAGLAGVNPYAYRRRLLSEPRARDVLDLAAEHAAWGSPPATGRARGMALVREGGTFVALVAEVSRDGAGIRVHRIVCAVDCGTVVHPNGVEAQLEGGIVFGLTLALKGQIRFTATGVRESSFGEYPLLGFAECPEIEVHLVPSSAPPTGVGEVGVSGVAPAVANALLALDGTRSRGLPLE